MRRVWWSRIARLLCLRGLDGMGSHAHRRVANVGASPTGSSGVCGRPLRVLAAAHCMARSRLALRMLAARSARCGKKVAQSAKRHVEHRHSPTPRPRHCHARTRCPAPCTRAHACRARSTRTHHACAPRQPCTRTTRQHALKSLAAVLESLATGCPSAGSPLAHLARMRSTNTLAISAARPQASHAPARC